MKLSRSRSRTRSRSRSRSPRDLALTKAIAKAHKWMKTPGAKAANHPLRSGYDRDDILAENPHATDIIALNQYLLTNDMQDHSCESDRQTIQRPYVSFLTTKKTMLALIAGLENDKNLLLQCGPADDVLKHTNKAMRRQYKPGDQTEVTLTRRDNGPYAWQTGYIWDRERTPLTEIMPLKKELARLTKAKPDAVWYGNVMWGKEYCDARSTKYMMKRLLSLLRTQQNL